MTKNGLFDFSYGVQERARTANKQHFHFFFFFGVCGGELFLQKLGSFIWEFLNHFYGTDVSFLVA